MRFTIARLVIATIGGFVAAVWLPPLLHFDPRGAAGVTASAGVAGWIELALLRHSLTSRVGNVSAPVSYTARLWASALVAGAIGRGAYLALPPLHPC